MLLRNVLDASYFQYQVHGAIVVLESALDAVFPCGDDRDHPETVHLAGEVAVGKSTLVKKLATALGWPLVQGPSIPKKDSWSTRRRNAFAQTVQAACGQNEGRIVLLFDEVTTVSVLRVLC